MSGACAPPSTPGCTSDAACLADQLCVDGACVARTEQVACTFFGDPACDEAEVCSLSAAGSCPNPPCAARLECQPPVGATPPLYACAADDACTTGRCLDGMCLAVCGSLPDCPGGFGCEEVELGARTLRRCIPIAEGAADFGAVRCDRPEDCAEGRSCRFAIDDTGADRMTPSCRLPLEARPLATGSSCERVRGGADACFGGACMRACSEPGRPLCLATRCASPCLDDAGCDAPFRCVSFHEERTIDGRPLRQCALAIGTCLDQLDCCRAGTACDDGWPMADGICASTTRSDGGVTSECVERDVAKGDLGAPCVDDADCASALCVTPSIGGAAFCSSPCITADDRCDAILLGTRCELLRGERYATRVHACR